MIPTELAANVPTCQSVSTAPDCVAGLGMRAPKESAVLRLARAPRLWQFGSIVKRSIQLGVTTNSGIPSPSRSIQPETVEDTAYVGLIGVEDSDRGLDCDIADIHVPAGRKWIGLRYRITGRALQPPNVPSG